ncbi:Ribonuclease R [bioreactor metagenome]|uniref:Ribonuclease R n=1 Tax=bioreactor metagenome TaxID=1076179 RepID=A0A644YUT1_9ZZZZ
MEIDTKGAVVGHKISKSVIKSDRRMTYNIVNEIVENDNEQYKKEYADFLDMFNTMLELRNILLEKRRKRGSVNFDLPECKIILNDIGEPIEIKPHERNTATSIIEEFMLICNETIAEDYFWQELPFVYRNHEVPDEEKIKKLTQFIFNFGYRFKGNTEDIHPKAIAQLLNSISGKPEEHIISRVVLRSMKQAKYMPESLGHFGLAAKYYCHFTSPIRRYPDLQIHRIIKENLAGGLNEKRITHYNKILADVSTQSSKRERLAEEAERETDNLKKVQYMTKHIGEKFMGIISGVTNWGIFVELSNTVEGLVALNTLRDDFYVFNPDKMCVTGEHTNKKYSLGDKITIMVDKADVENRTIDFIITE